MLVAKADWITRSLRDRAAIQELLPTATVSSSSTSAAAAGGRTEATTAPLTTSSRPVRIACAARARTRTGSRPPDDGSSRTSPGSWPSTASSTIGPEVAKVRPARTAAAHVSKERASPSARRAYVLTAPTGTSADILSVPPRREALHLDRVDPVAHDVRGHLAVGQREVRGDGHPARLVAAIGPIGHQLVHPAAHTALRWAAAGHREHRPPGPDEGE